MKKLACLLALLASSAYSAPPVPPNLLLNLPTTPQRIELGRKLFFDPRMSQTGTVACATCHNPNLGYSDGLRLPVGITNPASTRNSPTLINAVYAPLQFWDGRTDGPTQQATQPLVNPQEMGNDSVAEVADRLASNPSYAAMFQAAYGKGPNRANIGHAIASFETTLIGFDAPIDKRVTGDRTALTPQAERGFQLALQANCFSCHKPPLYTDMLFHNTGIARRFNTGERGRAGVLRQNQRTSFDVRAVKTPTLREIARTAPYTHAGIVLDLAGMVRHYNTVAMLPNRDPFLDPRLATPPNLSLAEERDFVVFLTEAFMSASYPYVSPPVLP
jgi:cytochrome c peroxidase